MVGGQILSLVLTLLATPVACGGGQKRGKEEVVRSEELEEEEEA